MLDMANESLLLIDTTTDTRTDVLEALHADRQENNDPDPTL
jgi:hypothetical protein